MWIRILYPNMTPKMKCHPFQKIIYLLLQAFSFLLAKRILKNSNLYNYLFISIIIKHFSIFFSKIILKWFYSKRNSRINLNTLFFRINISWKDFENSSLYFPGNTQWVWQEASLILEVVVIFMSRKKRKSHVAVINDLWHEDRYFSWNLWFLYLNGTETISFQKSLSLTLWLYTFLNI